MREEDRHKINDFKRQFRPTSLPDEILQSWQFIVGDDISKEQFYKELTMHRGGPSSQPHVAQQMHQPTSGGPPQDPRIASAGGAI